MDISLFFHKKPHDVKHKSSKRFDNWSRKYDRSILQFLVFRQSHDMFLKNILSDNAISKTLDVGCGTGELALKLKQTKKELDVSGVDLSPEMVSIAKSKAKYLGYADIKFKVGDVGNMPYEDNSFDCITCAHSFHHYPLKKKAVKEMFRILKSDGRIMIIDGYKDGLLGKLIFDFIVKRHEREVHHLHSDQFRRLLTNVGFKEIIQKTFNFGIPLLLTKGVARKES